MTSKLRNRLSAVLGALIVLSVLAMPWVTIRIADVGNPEAMFPYLPFTNGLVEALSGTVILFELFCGCLALIALGIHLTQLGTWSFNKHPTHVHPRT